MTHHDRPWILKVPRLHKGQPPGCSSYQHLALNLDSKLECTVECHHWLQFANVHVENQSGIVISRVNLCLMSWSPQSAVRADALIAYLGEILAVSYSFLSMVFSRIPASWRAIGSKSVGQVFQIIARGESPPSLFCARYRNLDPILRRVDDFNFDSLFERHKTITTEWAYLPRLLGYT